MNRRSLGYVEHLGLNKGLIYVFAHLTAEGVDFSYQVSLRGASYMRVAGHHSDAVNVHCKDHSLKSEPAAGQCGFNARMTGSDHAHLCINVVFHTLPNPSRSSLKLVKFNYCFTYPYRI